MTEVLGKHAELRKITQITSVRGSESRGYDPKKGIGIDMDGLLIWDGRFGIYDLEVGDIVKVENEGPSSGMIAEVFREGLRIYPETPEKLSIILENIKFRRRLQKASSSNNS